jgi:hypothetical protein
MMLGSRYQAVGVLAAMITVAGWAGCGGSESEQNYSASAFSECLLTKDVGPRDIASGQSEGDRYFDALNRLAGQAARENGAIEAFGNDALPGASTTYFLFFAAHDAAKAAEQTLQQVAREEQSSDKLDVRGNLLTVASRETEAQTQIVDECLNRSQT